LWALQEVCKYAEKITRNTEKPYKAVSRVNLSGLVLASESGPGDQTVFSLSLLDDPQIIVKV
jgi:hypothetical protein